MRRRLDLCPRARSLAPPVPVSHPAGVPATLAVFAVLASLPILLPLGCAGGDGGDDSAPAFTYPVTLSWQAPRTNADGTPLKDLAGFRVYAGTKPRVYTTVKDVRRSTTATLDLPEGLHTFAVTAYDLAGNESEFSEEVSAVLPLATGARG